MPTIRNVRLEITPGNSSSEARVTYNIQFENAAVQKNFRETIMLMSHDGKSITWIPKIIGYVVNDHVVTASGTQMEREFSRFFSNEDLNEDASKLDDYYAVALLEPVATSGSAKSNVVKRKF